MIQKTAQAVEYESALLQANTIFKSVRQAQSYRNYRFPMTIMLAGLATVALGNSFSFGEFDQNDDVIVDDVIQNIGIFFVILGALSAFAAHMLAITENDRDPPQLHIV